MTRRKNGFSQRSAEAGFTLLELAVVMVIISLLLAAVIDGDRVVDEGRIKRLALDVAHLRTAVRTYEDLYLALPGDDPAASKRWPDSGDGNGDGRLDGPWYAASSKRTETALFWTHLQHAGLFNGGDGPPKHIAGGRTGVADAPLGLTGPAICFNDLPADHAIGYDIQFDDGKSDSGRVRGGGEGVTAGGGYRFDSVVMVCELI